MALITCPKCGQSVSEEAKFCPNCGHAIKNDEKTKRKLPKWLKRLLIALGIIVGVFAALFLILVIIAVIQLRRENQLIRHTVGGVSFAAPAAYENNSVDNADSDGEYLILESNDKSSYYYVLSMDYYYGTAYADAIFSSIEEGINEEMDITGLQQAESEELDNPNGFEGTIYFYDGGTYEGKNVSFSAAYGVSEKDSKFVFAVILTKEGSLRNNQEEIRTFANTVTTTERTAGASNAAGAASAPGDGADSNGGKTADSDSSSDKAAGVTPSLKKTMDAYESFVDDYIAFLKKYSNGNTDNYLEMLGDYTEFVAKYAEFAEEIENMDTSSFSAADYAYYLEVTTRVNSKLAAVADLIDDSN